MAYSTVAQIGYLFLLFPLAANLSPAGELQAAWNGAIYQMLSHALAKASLFLAAGAVLFSLGHDRLEGIDGMAQQFPTTLFAIGLAGMSLMGLPPSGGFVAKWLLIQAALVQGRWWWALVLVSGGLLAAAYIFRILRHAFVSRQSIEPWRPVPSIMEHSALVLAVLALMLGFTAAPLLTLLGIGAPFPQGG